MTDNGRLCDCGQAYAKPQYVCGDRMGFECCDACMAKAYALATEPFIEQFIRTHGRAKAKA